MAEKKYTPFPKSYKDCKYPDIEKWCIANNEVEWLIDTMAKKSEHKVYPKKVNEFGKPIKYKGEDGKTHYVKDMDALPTTSSKPISFTKVKSLFFDEFFPAQKKDPNAKTNKTPKKASMHERAIALAKVYEEAMAKQAANKAESEN